MIRSATSVGANYVESQSASSKRDFRNKIYICKKEITETSYWLKFLDDYGVEDLDLLKQEAYELTLIFGKIISKLNSYIE